MHTLHSGKIPSKRIVIRARSYRFREAAVRGEAVEVEARNGWRNQRITITLTFTPDSLEGNAMD